MAINIKGLIKMYGTVRAINGVDLQAKKSDVIGIFGSKGSGKTTLIDVVCGVKEKNAGEILSASKATVITCEDMLVKELTIKENVELHFRGKKNNLEKNTAKSLLQQSPVKLPVYPINLTMFEIYVIAIIKAAVISPGIVLIDDFFCRVGSDERNILWEFLLSVIDNHECIILFTTDDKNDLKYASTTYRLSHGKLYEEIS